jgi:hypothetical protein
MAHTSRGVTALGRRLRYFALLAATPFPWSSVEQVEEAELVAFRHLRVIAVLVLVIVAMVVSIREEPAQSQPARSLTPETPSLRPFGAAHHAHLGGGGHARLHRHPHWHRQLRPRDLHDPSSAGGSGKHCSAAPASPPFAHKIVIVQGGFMTRIGDAAGAAGYHDDAGPEDVRTWNLTTEEQRILSLSGILLIREQSARRRTQTLSKLSRQQSSA